MSSAVAAGEVPMKKALITGASSGIGREFALQLARAGYRILAVARREERLQELLAELPGEQHSYRVADLSSQAGRERVLEAITQVPRHKFVDEAPA